MKKIVLVVMISVFFVSDSFQGILTTVLGRSVE